MLERELEYFKTIQAQLEGENPNGGFAVIKDNQLLGVWKNREDALKQGVANWGNVPFLVKNITDNPATTISFSRPLKFANAIPHK